MRRFLLPAAASVVAILTGAVLAPNPLLAAVALGTVALLVWTATLDVWRFLFGVTVLLLAAASSSVAAVAGTATHLRFAAAACLLAWTWAGQRQSRPLSACPAAARRLVTWFWLLAMLSLLSTLWSAARSETLQQSIALMLLVGLLHGLVTRRWADPDRIAADLAPAVVVLTATFVAGLAADVPGTGVVTRSVGGRFQGLYANPNTLGMAAVLVTCLAVGIYRGQRSRRWLLAAVGSAAMVVLCQSRTAVVALLLAGLWLAVRAGARGVARTAAVGALTLLLLFGALPALGGRTPTAVVGVTDRFTADEGGDLLNTRTVAWRAAADLWLDRIVVGYGFRAGETVFTREEAAGRIAFVLPTVHNSYLQALLELGLVGMVPLAMILLAIGDRLRRANVIGVGAGLVAAAAGGLAVQATESSMFGTGQVFSWLFWMTVAASTVHGQDQSVDLAPSAAQEQPAANGSSR